MVGVRACVLTQPPSCFEQYHEFSDKSLYLFANLLLSKSSNWIKNVEKITRDKDMCESNLDFRKCKQKSGYLKNPGGCCDGQASDDSLLPGLHNDMALDILASACRSDYPKLACINKKLRSLIGSGYLYKLRKQHGILEHWIYVNCCSMPWEAFDIERQRWIKLPTLPCDQCFTLSDKESLAVGTELLVFGRELSGNVIWLYSLVRHDWSRCSAMNQPRCLFASSSHGGIAIVAGGCDKNGRVLKSAELYNSELGTWELLPDMNVPRKMCSGFFMDGKFFVIGGMASHTESLTCGEEYNFETRTWRRIMDMHATSGRPTEALSFPQSPPLVAVVKDELYAANQVTNEVNKYDKENNRWRIVKRLPVRADSSDGWGLAFKSCGDKILVVGSHRRYGRESVVLYFWCPEDGNTGEPEWNVLSIREGVGGFVYNCAVMSC